MLTQESVLIPLLSLFVYFYICLFLYLFISYFYKNVDILPLVSKIDPSACVAEPDWVCFQGKSSEETREPIASARSSGHPPSGRMEFPEDPERLCELPCCGEVAARVSEV